VGAEHHGTESCDAICLMILDKSCKYCKLKYDETEDGVFEFRYSNKHRTKKVIFTKDREDLFDFIFVSYIGNNLNMDTTVIIVSDYLNKC
jgi:hypothetical protein